MTRRLQLAALAVACASVLVAPAVSAQDVQPRPIAKDHPVVGRWTWTLPDGSCAETYQFRSDGTSVVTSGDEIAETVFEISAQPDRNGFYKWTDKLVKDNGRKDCAGGVTEIGKVATNYVVFNRAGDIFLVCAQPSLDACFGPFIRARGQAI